MASLDHAAESGNNLDRRGGNTYRHRQAASAKARLFAWCCILDAVAEMRSALDYRIWRENPEDTHLEADIQTWCELAHGLADFLRSRRSV